MPSVPTASANVVAPLLCTSRVSVPAVPSTVLLKFTVPLPLLIVVLPASVAALSAVKTPLPSLLS